MALTIDLLRPEDLVSVTVEAINLHLNTDVPLNPTLVRDVVGTPAFLIIHFPPQAIAEQAFYEDSSTIAPPKNQPDPIGTRPDMTPNPPGLVAARMAGGSKLVFRIPDTVQSLPYTLAGLLDWERLDPSLAPVAAVPDPPQFGPDSPPAIAPPTATETGLELPYRLLISPGLGTAWRHASMPVTQAGRTALWHTRLVQRTVTGAGEPAIQELDDHHTAPVRAIWSPDFAPRGTPPPARTDEFPFLSSLSPLDRHQLVLRTSAFPGPDEPAGTGIPAQAKRLMLSALGGWLDVHGVWPDSPLSIDLIGWRHLATMARDHYVRVVYQGRLFPFGHRASLVKITERRIEGATGAPPLVGSPTAYLRQFMYVVPRDRELRYQPDSFEHQGREMPFWPLVRINTPSTPKIDVPIEYIRNPPTDPAAPHTESFWINVGGAPFPFSLTAIDLRGNQVDFTAGLIFMSTNDFLSPDGIPPALRSVREVYVGGPRAADVASQRVTFAPPLPGSDTTTFNTNSLSFDAELGRGEPGFLPKLDTADVRLQSVEQITGSNKPATIQLYQPYLDSDIDPNAGVFATILSPLPVRFSADQAGGIAQPNLNVGGLARQSGPVAGSLANAASDTFDPADFFKGLDASLFGVLKLTDLIDGADGFLARAPRITTTLEPDPANPQRQVTRLHWQTKVKSAGDGLKFVPATTSQLSIDVLLEQPLPPPTPPPTPTVTVDGELTDFELSAQSVIRIGFDRFRFHSATGEKTTVEVSLADQDPIEFLGALAFVNKLTEVIPPGIFGSNGPKISLLADRISVGFGIGLPPLTLGVFSLTNVAVSTLLDLPFLTGKPAFAFSFSERHRPFLLTVTLLGGGGFFNVELDTERIVRLEAMLEFGGAFCLDIGVASGSVHVMAGIYLGLQANESQLSGFVDLGGELSVLGLISVSLEFNLSLSYDFAQKVARGTAVIIVAVSIAFFSTSVSLSVERSFSAGSDHISIGQVLTPEQWKLYADAFA